MNSRTVAITVPDLDPLQVDSLTELFPALTVTDPSDAQASNFHSLSGQIATFAAQHADLVVFAAWVLKEKVLRFELTRGTNTIKFDYSESKTPSESDLIKDLSGADTSTPTSNGDSNGSKG